MRWDRSREGQIPKTQGHSAYQSLRFTQNDKSSFYRRQANIHAITSTVVRDRHTEEAPLCRIVQRVDLKWEWNRNRERIKKTLGKPVTTLNNKVVLEEAEAPGALK